MFSWGIHQDIIRRTWYRVKRSPTARVLRRTTTMILKKARRRKKKLVKAGRRISSANGKARRAAQNAIISSLPGFSKVKVPNSPAPRLLLSNKPHTDSESTLIIKAIQMAQAEATRWSDILAQRRQEGQTNRAWEIVTMHKIDRVNLFILQHQGVVSVVRRLPTEILQEIFLLAAQAYRASHFHLRRFDEAPWVLGQICKTWRTTCLGTPTVWNHLPNLYLENSRTTTKVQMQYVEELLRRSKGALLDVAVDYQNFDGETHPVFDLLCQYAERWETTYIALGRKDLLGLRSINGRLISLKSLILWKMSSLPLEESTIGCFQEAPLLTMVYLNIQTPQTIPLPYGQLLHYEGISTETQITPVINSRVLQTLTLIVNNDFFFPAVTLPCLVGLYVYAEFVFSPLMPNFFDDLILPALEDIKILAPRCNLVPSLIRMFSKSAQSPLKKFVARFSSLEANELSNLLLLIPTLIKLNVTMPPDNSDILNLAFGYKNRPLVPLLETCEFHTNISDDTDLAMDLNKLAASRCELEQDTVNANTILPREIQRLKTLCIRCANDIDSDVLYQWHARLEEWTSTFKSKELALLRVELSEKVPHIYREYYEQFGYYRSTESVGKNWSYQIGQILTKIQANIEVKDVNDIFHSGILYMLKPIAAQHKTSGNVELARNILAQWQPLLDDPETLKRRHWTIQGMCGLQYVSNDSILRKDSEGAISIIYGTGRYDPAFAIYHDY